MATKIIWMYWHQGWEQAPDLVKQCAESWRLKNLDYEIHLLDRDSVTDYISLPKAITFRRKKLTIQKNSNLIRLALLSKFGGVWSDASVFCNRSLGGWLGEYYDSLFFAFRNPGKDRLLANWFLAAESESVILQRLYARYSKYFADNSFSNQGTALGKMFVNYFNRRWNADYRTTGKWFSWFARKILRVYPYFIFHYTFNQLILTDPECAALWNRAKPFPAEPLLRIKYLDPSEDGMLQAKREIASRLVPMHKLNWRIDSTSAFWSTVLRYLREQAD
jgi:hypothetical protein